MTETISTDVVEGIQAPSVQPELNPSRSESSFTLPDEYKERGWAEKIKSTDDLFKAYDNAQSLIGKRPAGIPSDNASDEEWSQFYKAMGRPDEPSYEFTDPEELPEGFETSTFKEHAAKILHDAGLNQKQADKIYQSYMNNEIKAGKERQVELDNKFNELSQQHFGDDIEKYMESTKADFDKHVPQDLKQSFAALENNPDALVALLSYTKGKNAEIEAIKKQYNAEGSITSGGQASTQDISAVRSELAQLRMSKDAIDFTSPNHQATMDKIRGLSESVERYYSKK